MKIVVVNGQNHKGSTYHIGKMLTEKLGGEVTEFFLPRDFDQICGGCTNCFVYTEDSCPHIDRLKVITAAMDEADVLIFTSPVYVFHATGSMKVLLDHYGYRWMVHRPEEKMFKKQAVCITTAAGAGMKSAIKDMADSLFFWGVPKIYKLGFAVRATSFEKIDGAVMSKIERKTSSLAKKIKKNVGRVHVGIKTRFMFAIMGMMQKSGWNEADVTYWKSRGWLDGKKPWSRKKS